MIRLGAIADAPAALAAAKPAPKELTVADVPATAGSARSAPHTMMEEAFRTLRSKLLLRAPSDVRTFLFASARPGEGKSTIAANLACSLAGVQKRVLLIDADLRRPAAHRLFQVSNTRGLTDVLRGTCAGADAWQLSGRGPFVLPCGPLPDDPQALFETGHFAKLMADARRQFDVVLVDSAPLLAVADTTLMVPHIDAAVFVVRYGGVTEGEAALALERLHGAGGKVVGCVLSQVAASDDGFHSYASDYVKSDARAASRRDPS